MRTWMCASHSSVTANGPFDGLLGFSQGATFSALLIGYQTQGKILKEHPPMKLFVSISGSKFSDTDIRDVAYKDQIKVKSVHFIGAKDYLRQHSEELATAFDNALIIRHPQGHTFPRLEKADVEKKEYISSILESVTIENAENFSENGISMVDELVGEVEKRQPKSMKVSAGTCV